MYSFIWSVSGMNAKSDCKQIFGIIPKDNLYFKSTVVICRLCSWCICFRNRLWLYECSLCPPFLGKLYCFALLVCHKNVSARLLIHLIKLEYFKTLHACILTYKIFHIVTTVWSNHFWRSYCPFCIEIFH